MHTHTPPENKKDNNVLIMKTFAQSVEQILTFILKQLLTSYNILTKSRHIYS